MANLRRGQFSRLGNNCAVYGGSWQGTKSASMSRTRCVDTASILDHNRLAPSHQPNTKERSGSHTFRLIHDIAIALLVISLQPRRLPRVSFLIVVRTHVHNCRLRRHRSLPPPFLSDPNITKSTYFALSKAQSTLVSSAKVTMHKIFNYSSHITKRALS